MNSKETFTDQVREALAKKQEAARPKAKKHKSKHNHKHSVPVITGSLIRKASGRGG